MSVGARHFAQVRVGLEPALLHVAAWEGLELVGQGLIELGDVLGELLEMLHGPQRSGSGPASRWPSGPSKYSRGVRWVIGASTESSSLVITSHLDQRARVGHGRQVEVVEERAVRPAGVVWPTFDRAPAAGWSGSASSRRRLAPAHEIELQRGGIAQRGLALQKVAERHGAGRLGQALMGLPVGREHLFAERVKALAEGALPLLELAADGSPGC